MSMTGAFHQFDDLRDAGKLPKASPMIDTIEAVARAIHASISNISWEDTAMQDAALRRAQAAITAHTKALIEGAGEVVAELEALHVWPQSIADHQADVLTPRQIERLYDVGKIATQAAATIAALRTEVERAKMDGVRAGIEAAAKWLNCAADLAGPGPYKSLDVPIRKQCLRDAAEGVLSGAMDFVPDTRAAALSDLIAGDADLIVPDTLADSDGDDGA